MCRDRQKLGGGKRPISMIILIVALKCILWAVIVVFSAVLIGLALPVSVKASGWLSVEDNFEEASCKA